EPKNPIVQTRSFGADPTRVGEQAAVWVRGCQEHGALACAKHYPGHGRTTQDSHQTLPRVTAPAAELERVDLAPFEATIRAAVARADEALSRYEQASAAWDSGPDQGQPDLAANAAFADGLADRAVHVVRGEPASFSGRAPLDVHIVDDDIGGPYSVGPRDVFH